MESSRPHADQLANWQRLATGFARANWPSSKIRAYLVELGCPTSLARKIASVSSKKQGLKLIALGVLSLFGWLVLGLLRSSGLPIPGIAILAALLVGLGIICYGLFQFIFD
jgi:hypothetical protein